MALGKATEHRVTTMLLEEGRTVLLPAVDDDGVDIVVLPKTSGVMAEAATKEGKVENDVLFNFIMASQSNGQYGTLQAIQVKSISTGGLFAAISCPNPRPNYWFVFYIKDIDTIWLINSMDFVKIASRNVTGKNKGKYSLDLATKVNRTRKHTEYIATDFSRIP